MIAVVEFFITAATCMTHYVHFVKRCGARLPTQLVPELARTLLHSYFLVPIG